MQHQIIHTMQSLTIKYLVALVLMFLIVRPTDGTRITFWSDTDFNGEKYEIEMSPGQCYTLGVSNDRLSSVSTYNTCVDLYSLESCGGSKYRMEANSDTCHRDFRQCDINDKISSVRLCHNCGSNNCSGNNNGGQYNCGSNNCDGNNNNGNNGYQY